MNQFRLKLSSISRTKGRPPLDKYRYITRKREYADRPDLMGYGEINVPKVFGDSETMWKMCEKYERKNAQLYYDIEANLPENMTKEQYERIAKDFINTTFSERTAVSYAIHNKRQLDGKYHPHIHIMFSSRQFPDISGVTPKDMFDSRIAPKYDGYSKKKYLYFIRENFADSCNRELIKAERLPDMKSESYKTLKKKAEENKDYELAQIYDRLNKYKKPHNDESYVRWITKRREIEKNIREKGNEDMFLSEIQKLSVMNYEGIRRKEYRERLYEHEEKLKKDRIKKKEQEMLKNEKDMLLIFYERLRECNRLYRKSREFEDISRTKVEGMYAEILGEDVKNYKINLPHFISDGDLHVNRDVIDTRNTKQIQKKIKELSKLEKQLDTSENLSEYSKYAIEHNMNFALTNGILLEELRKRQKKKDITDTIVNEMIDNVIEHEARRVRTMNPSDDILDRKLRDKSLNQIIHEINDRNLANAYLLYRIEELEESIITSKFPDDPKSPLNMGHILIKFNNRERGDIMRNLEENADLLSDIVNKGFDVFSEKVMDSVTIYGRYKGGQPDYYNRRELTKLYNDLKDKEKSYEDEYNTKLKILNTEDNKNTGGLFSKFSFGKKEKKIESEIVKKELTNDEKTRMAELYEILYSDKSELTEKENLQRINARKDYEKTIENLEKIKWYREVALEFLEFASAYDERHSEGSEYSENIKEFANEIARFKDIQPEKSIKNDTDFPF